jgi:hypothetical protein
VLGINQQFDAAGGSRLPSDESFPFERQHHLVNRRRRDAKILLHVGFGRRPAMQGVRQALRSLSSASTSRAKSPHWGL